MPTKRITFKWNGAVSNTQVTSHSLGRAILANMYRIYDEDEVQSVLEEKIAISKPTPTFTDNGKRVFTYPMPKLFPNVKKTNKIKTFKKVAYFQSDLLTKLSEAIKQFFEGEKYQISNQVLLEKKLTPSFHREDENIMHNTLKRYRTEEDSSSTEAFYSMETSFYEGIEFTFHISGSDRALKMMTAGTKLLAEMGYGKRTSIGLGQFTIVEIENTALPSPKQDEHSLLLSSWLPSKAELEQIVPITYEIGYNQPITTEKRDGRKPLKGLRYVEAGGLLKGVDNQIIGRFENIGNKDHPSFFNGAAIVIGGISN